MIIFGGSFDPVHMGHVKIITVLKRQFKEQRIDVIPCYMNPLKSRYPLSSPEKRIRMLELVKMRHSFFHLNTIEIKRKFRYTYETIEYLRSSYAGRIYFVIGSDSLLKLDKWRNSSLLNKWVNFIVVKRRGYRIPPRFSDKAEYSLLRMEYMGISSSQIRKNVAADRSIKHLVTKEVAEYISLNNLYR